MTLSAAFVSMSSPCRVVKVVVRQGAKLDVARVEPHALPSKELNHPSDCAVFPQNGTTTQYPSCQAFHSLPHKALQAKHSSEMEDVLLQTKMLIEAAALA